MPSFHVHWLVAWRALDELTGAARSGRAGLDVPVKELLDEAWA